MRLLLKHICFILTFHQKHNILQLYKINIFMLNGILVNYQQLNRSFYIYKYGINIHVFDACTIKEKEKQANKVYTIKHTYKIKHPFDFEAAPRNNGTIPSHLRASILILHSVIVYVIEIWSRGWQRITWSRKVEVKHNNQILEV